MELTDKRGTRYVLEDGCLRVLEKDKEGYDSYSYPACQPSVVKKTFGGYALKIAVAGHLPLDIVVANSDKDMLKRFFEELEQKIDKAEKARVITSSSATTPRFPKTFQNDEDDPIRMFRNKPAETSDDDSNFYLYRNSHPENNLTKESSNTIRCSRCGGQNINIQMIQEIEHIKGKSEVRKKSVVTRAGNKMGRGAMIAATGGLWALTPKKSDYVEKSKTTTSIQHKKMCICQECGNSWEIK